MAKKKSTKKSSLRSKNSAKRKKKKGFRLKRFLGRLILWGSLALLALLTSVYFGFWGPIPSRSELAAIQQSEASKILSKDGELIDKIYRVNREIVVAEELPEHLIQALVATEDERFFEHNGVDYRSLMRVAVKSILLQDQSAGGGSTISQQLAKNLFGRKDFGAISILINKVKELITALRLENIYAKEEIITLYFNTVSFSENTYGIAAGSQRFFNKECSDLRIEEAAVLVGLLKANTYYNPRLNPDPALRRRNVVLTQMERNEYLSAKEVDSLQALPLNLNYANLKLSGPAPYYSAQVQAELKNILADKLKANGEPWDPRSDGLVIHTSLKAKKQRALQNAYDQHLANWQKKFDAHWSRQEPWARQPRFFDQHKQSSPFYQRLAAQGLSDAAIEAEWEKERKMELYSPAGRKEGSFSMNDSLAHYLKLLRGASLILAPRSGAVEAWVGGPNYRYLPFDAAAAKHSVASTFKPIVLAAALEAGFDPCEYQSAEQRVYPQYDNWTPRNYDNDYDGFYSMAGTLQKSVNTATVAWYLATGGLAVRELARKMGLGPDFPEGPSLALGTASASPLQMAVAYAAFANGGYRVEPYFIEAVYSKQGDLIYKHEPVVQAEVLSPGTARIMADLLQGVVQNGTARSLTSIYGLKAPWAAKTGTSQNYSDAWFAAFSPQEVSVTWMGGVSPLLRFRSGAYGSGSTMALPIFAKYAQGMPSNFNWPPLTEDQLALLDCEGYREENFWDRMREVLIKSPGEKMPEKEKESKEEDSEDSWFKRLFKRR